MYVKLLVLGRHVELVLSSPLPFNVTKEESEPNKICLSNTHRKLLLVRLNIKKRGGRQRFASETINLGELCMTQSTPAGFKVCGFLDSEHRNLRTPHT